ncbi:MAG: polymerase sigma-B factor, partial [Actinomycetota bacterium]|nr:polymerase sigma-B factor [Actinomycetota bacterium]
MGHGNGRTGRTMRDPTGSVLDSTARARLDEKHREFRVTHSRELRSELVEAHLGLARQVARRFTNRGEALDDLVQVATMALLKALDRYDPDRGVRFSTYATSSMTGELKRHFRDHAWAIRVPRSIQELHLATNEAVETLRHHLGRSPTIAEIAHYLGEPDEEVLLAVEAGRAYRTHSLDAPAPGEERSREVGDHDPEFDGAEGRHDLSPLLARLPGREQRILHLRFTEGLTQSEIADRVGLSQMHVSRL